MKRSSYFKYAIGEIALVVIGILIALSINNWNESFKRAKKERLTINILMEEIDKNLQQMSEDYQNNIQILDSLTSYLKGELKKKNEHEKAQFITYVLNYNWGVFEYPTLDQELGPNRTIQNSRALSSTLKALNTAHTAVDFQLNYLNELFNNQTVPYLLESGAGTGLTNTMFQYNQGTQKLGTLYDKESLRNIFSIQQLFLFSYNRRVQMLMEQSELALEKLREL